MSRFSARGRSKLASDGAHAGTGAGEYDVVIVGGAVAGASTAIVLKRGNPKLRILVVEKTERFDWKVGESTVEVSSYFLTRVLKQWSHLVRDQLPKQAFRYWFFNDDVTCLREASETGPTQLARTPSFQLDRAKLDEHLLKTAREEGTELWRPAKVTAWTLAGKPGPDQHAHRREERRHDRDGLLPLAGRRDRPAGDARAQAPRRHADRVAPTAAIWARYNDVKDMDGIALAGTDPADPWHRAVIAPRRLATNHFTGWGYWIWFIPLHDGEMSVGLVWDKGSSPPRARRRSTS